MQRRIRYSRIQLVAYDLLDDNTPLWSLPPVGFSHIPTGPSLLKRARLPHKVRLLPLGKAILYHPSPLRINSTMYCVLIS